MIVILFWKICLKLKRGWNAWYTMRDILGQFLGGPGIKFKAVTVKPRSCWSKFNESDCCRPKGLFFKVGPKDGTLQWLNTWKIPKNKWLSSSSCVLFADATYQRSCPVKSQMCAWNNQLPNFCKLSWDIHIHHFSQRFSQHISKCYWDKVGMIFKKIWNVVFSNYQITKLLSCSFLRWIEMCPHALRVCFGAVRWACWLSCEAWIFHSENNLPSN